MVILKPLTPKEVIEDQLKMKKREKKRKKKLRERKIVRKLKKKRIRKIKMRIYYLVKKSIKKVLLNKKKSILLLPTNMRLVLNSPLNSLFVAFERMLEEFKDIFPKEMLEGLPPIQGIELQYSRLRPHKRPKHQGSKCKPIDNKTRI
ncbi:hypothetical protein CR513_15377, partial [Mucuna pruriens]